MNMTSNYLKEFKILLRTNNTDNKNYYQKMNKSVTKYT